MWLSSFVRRQPGRIRPRQRPPDRIAVRIFMCVLCPGRCATPSTLCGSSRAPTIPHRSCMAPAPEKITIFHVFLVRKWCAKRGFFVYICIYFPLKSKSSISPGDLRPGPQRSEPGFWVGPRLDGAVQPRIRSSYGQRCDFRESTGFGPASRREGVLGPEARIPESIAQLTTVAGYRSRVAGAGKLRGRAQPPYLPRIETSGSERSGHRIHERRRWRGQTHRRRILLS